MMKKTGTRLAIADAGRGFSAVLKSRKLYEKVVRETRWTEGSVTIVGNGASGIAGLAAAQAFEWMRDIAEFGSYVLPNLPPRSVLIALSASGEDEDIVELVSKTRQRGGSALALTANPESRLGGMVRAAFVLPVTKEAPPATMAFLEHATFVYIACIAASVFNPRHPWAGSCEEEFASLPARLEWVQEQLGDAVESAAEVMKQARVTILAGGGLYHPSGLQAVHSAWQTAAKPAMAFNPGEILDGAPGGLGKADAAILLSGSNCRTKKRVHAVASYLKEKNVQLISITDHNDRALVQSSTLAILLPVLSEATGPLLALAVAEWLIAS
jgi:D-arabinose 5-phosphate isomerase GutQ